MDTGSVGGPVSERVGWSESEWSIRNRNGRRAFQDRDQAHVPGHRTRREVREVIRCP